MLLKSVKQSKKKKEREVAQSCLTSSDPMDWSGWGATAVSEILLHTEL